MGRRGRGEFWDEVAAAGHKPFKNGFLGYYRPCLGPGVIVGGEGEVIPVMDLGYNAVNLTGGWGMVGGLRDVCGFRMGK